MSYFDDVSIEISDVCVVHTWRVLASIEHLPSGRLHSLHGGVDAIGGTIGQVNAEVLPSARLAESSSILVRGREMEREGVAAGVVSGR